MLTITRSRLFSLCTILSICALSGCFLGPAKKKKNVERASIRRAANEDITISPSDTVWLVPGQKLTLSATSKRPGAQLSWEGVAGASYIYEAPTLAYPCETKEVSLTATATLDQIVKTRKMKIFVQNKSCQLNEASGLSSNDTTKLLLGKDKSLYIGTRSGLTWFKDGTATKILLAGNNEILQVVTALAQDDTYLYVGKARKLGPYPIKGFGVDRFKFRGTRYTPEQQAIFTDNYVSAIFFSRSGDTLVPEVLAAANYTTPGIVHRPTDLASIQGNPTTGSDLLKGESLYAGIEVGNRTYYGGDGGVWEFEDEKLIERFDGNEWNGKGGFLGMGSNRSVRALAADSAGTVWVGLQSGIFAKGGIVSLQPATSDAPKANWSGPVTLTGAGNDVRALAVDSADNLWIATDNGLVRRNVDGVFAVYGANSGLPSNDIRDLVYDANTSNLWIATGAGVQRWSLAQQ